VRIAPALCFAAAVLSGGVALADDTAAPPVAPAPAAKEAIVIWPTVTPAGDAPGPPLHRPTEADGALLMRAQELDATLRDAAQDLGFEVGLAGEARPTQMRDVDILDRAAHSKTVALPPGTEDRGSWVVSPRIEALGGDAFLVRLVVAEPNARELRVRVATVKGTEVAVKGLVMLRDALAPSPSAQAAQNERDRQRAGQLADLASVPAPRSQGRAILAVTGAVLGGFLAFAVQQASVTNDANATDPRVLLPLLTLGTGVGIGGSLLAAEEWDVTTGDALYLAAGAGWGAASGFFMSSAGDVQPLNSRYLWGAGAGLSGVTLSIIALTQKHIDDGGALLTHSGGAVGLYLGSAIELMYKGSFDRPPPTGQSIGSALGVVSAGIVATQLKVTPSRVLLLDLGIGLGGLVGAAATSWLLVDNPSTGDVQGFLSATLGGSVIGAVTAAILTRSRKTAPPAPTHAFGEPVIGPIGLTQSRTGAVPILGLGWRGEL